MRNSLLVILIIAIGGLSFSAYLSYEELFAATCTGTCGGGAILGYPPCLYGFLMYAAIVTVAIVGLARRAPARQDRSASG